MAPSKLPPSYPPYHHHNTTSLTSATAQTLLAEYIKSSETSPHLHPTSLLSTNGIVHGPNSGPSGGLAMHHLRRIEAGLRGENLAVETVEELRARFGDPGVEAAELRSNAFDSRGVSDMQLPVSDDTRLDAVIAESTGESTGRKRRKEGSENGSNKRQRTAEEISAWAEESSKAGSPADDVQDLAEYEQSQQPIIGEVGDRDGAPAVKQNGRPPVVLKHDEDGNIKVPKKKPKTEQDKAERNAAKKERRKAEARARLEASAAA